MLQLVTVLAALLILGPTTTSARRVSRIAHFTVRPDSSSAYPVIDGDNFPLGSPDSGRDSRDRHRAVLALRS